MSTLKHQRYELSQGSNVRAEPFQWNYTDSTSQNIASTRTGPKLQVLQNMLLVGYMFAWYKAIGAGLASLAFR